MLCFLLVSILSLQSNFLLPSCCGKSHINGKINQLYNKMLATLQSKKDEGTYFFVNFQLVCKRFSERNVI